MKNEPYTVVDRPSLVGGVLLAAAFLLPPIWSPTLSYRAFLYGSLRERPSTGFVRLFLLVTITGGLMALGHALQSIRVEGDQIEPRGWFGRRFRTRSFGDLVEVAVLRRPGDWRTRIRFRDGLKFDFRATARNLERFREDAARAMGRPAVARVIF